MEADSREIGTEYPVKFSPVWLVALLSLLPCRLQCTSLTFGQALELALNRQGNLGQASSRASQAANGHDLEMHGLEMNGRSASGQSCPAHLQDFAGIATLLTSPNELGFLQGGPVFTAPPGQLSAGAFDLDSSKSVILCTALLYAELDGLETEKRVLDRQQDFVSRLIDIESRRVSAEVDHPLLLMQAKLLRARTRMESEALLAFEGKTRSALSAVVGLPPDQVDPVENSLPPLSEILTSSPENRAVLQQLAAYRDIVQLDYASEYTSRLKVTHAMALGKSSIGSLVAIHVTEEMKFDALLQVNNQIRMAKIQFLGMSDDLENWAFGRTTSEPISPFTLPQSPESGSLAPSAGPDSSVPAPSLLSIVIAPNIKELQVGRSQQYSAIATYSNGRAKDVTTEAVWSCSRDTRAILSSAGFATGLSPGVITVNVKFQGLTHSRTLSIAEQPVDEYLSPDR